MRAFFEALSSDSPAPGGGAAAAIEAALGASLVAMVCRLTVGRPRFEGHEETLRAVIADADALRDEALDLADRDAAVYASLRAAYSLPKEDGSRAARIQDALVGATDTPLRVVEIGARVAGLCELIRDRSNPNLAWDVEIAAGAGRAAHEGAAILVRGNLASVRDAGYVARTSAALERTVGA